MISKIKLLSFTSLAFLFTASPASAQLGEIIANNLDAAQQATGIGDVLPLDSIAVNVINILLIFIGIFFIALIIYGGFVYMTAAGNQDRVDRGRKILMWAFIGLAIILLSIPMTRFIVNALLFSSTGVEV